MVGNVSNLPFFISMPIFAHVPRSGTLLSQIKHKINRSCGFKKSQLAQSELSQRSGNCMGCDKAVSNARCRLSSFITHDDAPKE